MTWIDQLEQLGASKESLEWYETQPDLETAWRHCTRGDWMMWLLYPASRGPNMLDLLSWMIPDEAYLALADNIRAEHPSPPNIYPPRTWLGRIWRELWA